MTTLVYPWSQEPAVPKQVHDKLSALGLIHDVEPDVLDKDILDRVMERLLENRSTGSWSVVLTNSAALIGVLSWSVAATWALTTRVSVHPCDPERFELLTSKTQDPDLRRDLFPFGHDAVRDAGLIVFSYLCSPARSQGYYSGAATRYFTRWARAGASFVGLAHIPRMDELKNAKILSLASETLYAAYGGVSAALVAERSKPFFVRRNIGWKE